jgi:hypothetical protein
MTEGKMGYEDFVYFILSEEDKSSEPSLEYWYAHFENYFYCLDCDIRSFQLKFLMGGGGVRTLSTKARTPNICSKGINGSCIF